MLHKGNRNPPTFTLRNVVLYTLSKLSVSAKMKIVFIFLVTIGCAYGKFSTFTTERTDYITRWSSVFMPTTNIKIELEFRNFDFEEERQPENPEKSTRARELVTNSTLALLYDADFRIQTRQQQ